MKKIFDIFLVSGRAGYIARLVRLVVRIEKAVRQKDDTPLRFIFSDYIVVYQRSIIPTRLWMVVSRRCRSIRG